LSPTVDGALIIIIIIVVVDVDELDTNRAGIAIYCATVGGRAVVTFIVVEIIAVIVGERGLAQKTNRIGFTVTLRRLARRCHAVRLFFELRTTPITVRVTHRKAGVAGD
jgi:hypothetical protein